MNNRQRQVNAKLKFRFKKWIGIDNSETTVDKKIGMIHTYEGFFGKSLLKCGNEVCFNKFKINLTKDRGVSLSTLLNYMNVLREFYSMILDTKKYSRYVDFRDLRYLNITRSQRNALNTSKGMSDLPAIEDWIKIVNSIEIKTSVDLRDRTLIEFALFGPSRIDTYRSLLLKHLKLEMGVVIIDSTKGASVKKNYANWGKLIVFEPELYQYFLDYISYLKCIGFTPDDPIFPSTLPYRLDKNGKLPFNRLSKKRYSRPNSLNAILKSRSIACGVPYFSFHRYRDLHSLLGERCCSTQEEIRAFKKNFGHKGADNFEKYYGGGNTIKFKRIEILEGIDFSKHREKPPTIRDLLDRIIKQDKRNAIINDKLDKIITNTTNKQKKER